MKSVLKAACKFTGRFFVLLSVRIIYMYAEQLSWIRLCNSECVAAGGR